MATLTASSAGPGVARKAPVFGVDARPLAIKHYTLAFDSSYPTGGESISDIWTNDFVEVKQILLGNEDGYVFDADLTNKKVLAYRAQTNSGAAVKSAVIAGGAAGALTVTGIATADTLIGVIRLDRDATAANINISSLTSEFTITGADTIDNTAGTNTTGDSLLVLYYDDSAATGEALNEVPNTTNLSGITALPLTVIGYAK